ncbi:DUF1294 domain-containing protein [Massilia glaciei]|uniref:DUF1294 domain-containing protein n=1 Tax=Massilia glaciei TaxID=1524097 RepID=A0A2U2HI20_9BURK|nr:DUF1294 domain-containing protein [Massilia glaciei]PWF45996.1 DUF1294 domain-containing protein [Massilia glaciei]
MPYIPIAVLVLCYLAIGATLGISHLVGALYLLMSVACFAAYARDKAAVRAGARRTSEAVLLMLGAGCGWPGAVLAQQWLRHKTSKASFRLRFFATVGANLAGFVLLATLPASRALFRLLPTP